MLLQLEDDQEFFRDTTARFLADKVPVATLRSLREDPAGFDANYWRQGAELGWTSMLVSEDDGGGSVSGQGLVDLALVAYEFGRAAAPGPLLPTAVVAGALSAAGGHDTVLKALLAGTEIATWAHGEPAPRGLGDVGTTVVRDGADIVVTGVKRPVESAAQASQLLVSGRTDDGAMVQALVPSDATGVTIEPMQSVDLTRRFCIVRLDSVRLSADALVGDDSDAAAAIEAQQLAAVVISAAESVGAMKTAFDMSVEWASDRYSFGRPLSSYQAIKHRFADMATWLEAGHALSEEAAVAVSAGALDAAKVASAAAAYIGDFGSELMQECVQFHGGIGVTYEHDLHLYLRRHTINRALHGTPSEHRRILGDLVISEGES